MSVTAARGFLAAAATAGLKRSGKPDVALVAAERPVPAAGVFTTNKVTAAPVRQSRAALAGGLLRAVVLNSGGANACTGPRGLDDAAAMAATAADALGGGPVAVASTGLIGVRLPMDLVLPAVAKAAVSLGPDGGAAADAIRTTDTCSKQAVASFGGVTVGGMAKGAGMLAPALATMLCVITTDADVSPDDLDAALWEATRRTFDRTDSDGCMSTNDSVYVLASGASGVRPSLDHLTALLTGVCADLATQLVDDAEGATKRVAITVRGAASEGDATGAARAIARSALLKCAVHGEDPNWGRVLAALGTSDAAFDPDAVDVDVNGVAVCRASQAYGDLDAARAAMATREVEIVVTLDAGDATSTVLTTDLTAAYVHENSAYST
ncbi:MAG TPA: bifunctional glutamate N-acetyltransferase/amino-acid acetyltransferase ArgJ [Frankiaceae bacterium]|jgi:glutamate N-acetyltransferase/amino-acid N-acetyltransferase|nr:bifunctional glutamate N-acetyltransferase/amino-acid acetyltransferase ArgJ [Frankiaceae bacterium]